MAPIEFGRLNCLVYRKLHYFFLLIGGFKREVKDNIAFILSYLEMFVMLIRLERKKKVRFFFIYISSVLYSS